MKKLLFLSAVIFQSILLHAQDMPKGLNVNENAPNFSLADQNGNTINLQQESAKGSVILVFYRGQWCPYCNKQLSDLEDSLSQIIAKGATLIAITPEKPENIKTTIKKTKAAYSILFDDGLQVMKAYDVAFTVDAATIDKYKKYGIDFNKANGINGANLPVPAIYVINKEGIIVYKYFDTDYTKRGSVKDILEHL